MLLAKVAERVAEDCPTLSMLAMVSLAVDPHAKVGEVTSLKEIPSDVEVNVFIETQDIEDAGPLPDQTARKSTLVTATVALIKLPELVRRGDVTHIELGEPLATPTPLISAEKVGEPSPTPIIREAQKESRGKGVLIGIIDVQGFDFAHPEFLRNGKTRFQGSGTRAEMRAQVAGTLPTITERNSRRTISTRRSGRPGRYTCPRRRSSANRRGPFLRTART